jgi:hypothetical protein
MRSQAEPGNENPEFYLRSFAFIRLHLRLKILNIKKKYNLCFVTQNTLGSKVFNHTKTLNLSRL